MTECDFETCELRGEIDPANAVRILRELSGRCDETNSTAAFRSAIDQAIGCLERGELVSAATIIGETAANVSGELHDCADDRMPDPTPREEELLGQAWADRVRQMNRTGHPLQADEEATDAYHTLDGLRHGFGYLHLGRLPNNVVIYEGGAR